MKSSQCEWLWTFFVLRSVRYKTSLEQLAVVWDKLSKFTRNCGRKSDGWGSQLKVIQNFEVGSRQVLPLSYVQYNYYVKYVHWNDRNGVRRVENIHVQYCIFRVRNTTVDSIRHCTVPTLMFHLTRDETSRFLRSCTWVFLFQATAVGCWNGWQFQFSFFGWLVACVFLCNYQQQQSKVRWAADQEPWHHAGWLAGWLVIMRGAQKDPPITTCWGRDMQNNIHWKLFKSVLTLDMQPMAKVSGWWFTYLPRKSSSSSAVLIVPPPAGQPAMETLLHDNEQEENPSGGGGEAGKWFLSS